MLKRSVRALGLTCLASVACWTSVAQGAATVSLKAVAKNGVAIAPTNNLTVVANDTITAEVFFFGWSSPPFDSTCAGGTNQGQLCTSGANCPGSTCTTGSGLIQTYQATLLGAAGAISNGADPNDNTRLVLPVGWNAPVARDSCPCDPAFPTCDPFYGCVGAGFNPASMGSVNTNCTGGSCTGGCCVSNFRSDFAFYGFDNIRSVDIASLNLRWGATINGSDAQSSSRCVAGAAAGFACTTSADCPGSTCNAGYLTYGGTLNLKVGSNPCGTYTFTLANDNLQTFLGNAGAFPVFALPAIEPLNLTVTGVSCPSGACCDTTNPSSPTCSVVPAGQCTGPDKRYGGNGSTCANINPPCAAVTGACCDTTNPSVPTCSVVAPAQCTGPNKRYGGDGSTCANINPPCVPPPNQWLTVDPPNCAVDARRPFNPASPAVREGFKQLILTFQNPPGAGENAANDFVVTQDPAAPSPPAPPPISSVVAGPGANQVTVNLQVAGVSNRWTCLRHIASNTTKCHGHLPADANSNRTVAPADILDIIDSLNGVRNPPLVIYQCDIDRSGVCLPADIITEIDLLNGATGFPVQNGDTLPVCPSAP